jgi:excisionase family DNA binding protein
MTENGRLLLDADQAAELLGLTRKQIYKLAREHQIPHLKVGRYLKFRRESLEAWIREQEIGATR